MYKVQTLPFPSYLRVATVTAIFMHLDALFLPTIFFRRSGLNCSCVFRARIRPCTCISLLFVFADHLRRTAAKSASDATVREMTWVDAASGRCSSGQFGPWHSDVAVNNDNSATMKSVADKHEAQVS